MIDVRYQHIHPSVVLSDGDSVRVLLGTLERIGRIYFAQDIEILEAGEAAWAQIRLDGPLPCMPGDRFVARRVSPVDTLGGGQILDPWTRRMRTKNRIKWGEQLARLHDGELGVFLDRASEEGLEPAEWAFRGGEGGEILGDRVFSASIVARLKGDLLLALTEYHASHALSLGANRRELRRGRLAHLPDRVFDDLVDQLSDNDLIIAEGPLMRVAGFEVGLSLEQVELQEMLAQRIADAGLKGLSVKELHALSTHDETAALMHLLEVAGTTVQVPGIGWLDGSALTDVGERVTAFFADNETMGTADFKEISGLTRKSAIPLLEWLDKNGVTRRDGDVRRKG